MGWLARPMHESSFGRGRCHGKSSHAKSSEATTRTNTIGCSYSAVQGTDPRPHSRGHGQLD